MVKLTKTGETVVLIILLVLSAGVRFLDLGYSNYYGDETKVLYLNKTVPATTFLLDQRKGPVQFLVAWAVETFSGGFSEFWIRIPFAVAGWLSVLMFYLFIRELYGQGTAVLSALIYAFSGLSVAFSRTVQYQSYLLLFAFSGLWILCLYIKTQRPYMLVFSALLLSLALLCHYDAIFYVLFAAILFYKFYKVKKIKLTYIFWYFITMAIPVLIFYIPYIVQGYFTSNTLGYLSRRISTGTDSLPNNSIYTFLVYNPFKLFAYFVIGFGLLGILIFFFKDSLIALWFLVPFIVFQFVFIHPGTHIMHYFIPLYVASALIVDRALFVYGKFTQVIVGGLFAFTIATQIAVSYAIFSPRFSHGYPWVDSCFNKLCFDKLDRNYQLFVYGFPYQRGWVQIASLLKTKYGARGFYTNDNTVVAGYYLTGVPVTQPGSNFYPEYYVNVLDNQELALADPNFLGHYNSLETVYVNSFPSAVIYKLKPDYALTSLKQGK